MRTQEHPEFQWNAGGWFGSQVGGTMWIFISAVIVMPRDTTVGLTTLALFVVVNAIATGMWMQRERLDPYRAIQVLIILAGIYSFAATWVLDRAGQFESLGVGGQVSAASMYLILALMIPAMLLLFHFVWRDNDAGS